MTEPTDHHLESLIRLLDDDDADVVSTVTDHIVGLGPDIVQPLRDIIRTIPDAVVRGRIEGIIRQFQQGALDDLHRLMLIHRDSGTDIDLESALYLLNGFGRPGDDRETVSDYLDGLALRVHEHFITTTPANDLTQLLAMNSVLFEEEQYQGAVDQYYDPQNSYLTSTIERRRGIPVTLCVLELLLADRSGLTLRPIALPYHFILYCPDIDVYVDPFHHGTFLSRTDCISFVERSGLTFTDGMLEPVRNLDIVIRMMRNLAFAHSKVNESWESHVLQQVLLDVAPQ